MNGSQANVKIAMLPVELSNLLGSKLDGSKNQEVFHLWAYPQQLANGFEDTFKRGFSARMDSWGYSVK